MTFETYEPVKGYHVIAEIGYSENYQWDLLAVLRRETDGRLVYYTDGGCSCNYEFMDAKAEDFIDLDSLDSPAFLEALNWRGTPAERLEFNATVRRALNR